jgi:hypothetical protein
MQLPGLRNFYMAGQWLFPVRIAPVGTVGEVGGADDLQTEKAGFHREKRISKGRRAKSIEQRAWSR